MKLSQIVSRTTLAAVVVATLSVTSQANAEFIRVTRGPNGAVHVVKSDKVPLDAKRISKAPKPASTQTASQRSNQKLITRGPNGASFIVNQ